MMLPRLGLALIAFGCLGALVACADVPDHVDPIPPTQSPSSAAGDPNDGTASDDTMDTGEPQGGEGETGPVEVEGAVVDGRVVPASEVPAPASDAGTDAGAGTMTIAKSQSCTSKYAAHTSVAKLSWTVTGTKIAITALAVQVHNSDGRDKNDVDVYETQPGASEVKQFNSGDILVSDKNVIVGWSGNKAPKSGTKVRISTNFDQSGADPSASCTLTVQ